MFLAISLALSVTLFFSSLMSPDLQPAPGFSVSVRDACPELTLFAYHTGLVVSRSLNQIGN
jgi:hypothetical protein